MFEAVACWQVFLYLLEGKFIWEDVFFSFFLKKKKKISPSPFFNRAFEGCSPPPPRVFKGVLKAAQMDRFVHVSR